MKTLKLIIVSVFISFGINAQKGNLPKPVKSKSISFESRAKIQTDKMRTELNLTNEQYEKAYQINIGIIQKNQNLQEQKMTTDERKAAVKQNNEARLSMLKNVLSEEQFSKLKEKIRERKSTEKAIEKN